jgi:hypothetical protein
VSILPVTNIPVLVLKISPTRVGACYNLAYASDYYYYY